MWVCGPLPKNLTLFLTETCDFPYTIYDLPKIRYPIYTLFLTCITISYLIQTDIVDIVNAFSVDGLIDNDEQVASPKKHIKSSLECIDHTLFMWPQIPI